MTWKRLAPFWKTRERLIASLLLVWLCSGAAFGLVVYALDYSNQATFSRLIANGVAIEAVVTGTRPSDHNTVFYRFEANGRTYFSGDRSWPPNPEASALSVGDDVHVVYDRRNPNRSCACDPQEAASANEWWRRWLAGLWLGIMPPVGIAAVLARRGLWPASHRR